jgi:hypothetical protein
MSAYDPIFKAHTTEHWWLDQGPEQCLSCAANVHLEALIHCDVCDRPNCSLCIAQWTEAGHVCVECARLAEEGN